MWVIYKYLQDISGIIVNISYMELANKNTRFMDGSMNKANQVVNIQDIFNMDVSLIELTFLYFTIWLTITYQQNALLVHSF